MWVMASITTPMFSINVNGELTDYFASSRGLRQLLMSILVMELVFAIYGRRVNEGFKLSWQCKREWLAHLCFADELLIFTKGELNSIALVKEVLDEFFLFSRLKLIHQKVSCF